MSLLCILSYLFPKIIGNIYVEAFCHFLFDSRFNSLFSRSNAPIYTMFILLFGWVLVTALFIPNAVQSRVLNEMTVSKAPHAAHSYLKRASRHPLKPRSVSVDPGPNYGKLLGNFQPPKIDATGGQVNNGNVAVYSINDNDGIGAGRDSYTLYTGNGNTFPQKSQWVSFSSM